MLTLTHSASLVLHMHMSYTGQQVRLNSHPLHTTCSVSYTVWPLTSHMDSIGIQHVETCHDVHDVHDGQHDKYLNNLTIDRHMYMYMYTYKPVTIGLKAACGPDYNMYML